jgi:hypothetical protein
MPFGSGKYSYEVVEGWGKLPEGWHWGWIPGVAVDSQDRVFVYSRSEHPLVLFDTGGNFLESWGEDVLLDAHGIFIDKEDNVWCTEWNAHCIRKFNKHGELQMTIGTPGQPGARPGDPFNLPTDLAIAFFFVKKMADILHHGDCVVLLTRMLTQLNKLLK